MIYLMKIKLYVIRGQKIYLQMKSKKSLAKGCKFILESNRLLNLKKFFEKEIIADDIRNKFNF